MEDPPAANSVIILKLKVGNVTKCSFPQAGVMPEAGVCPGGWAGLGGVVRS